MNCKELTNDLLADYAYWRLAPRERNRVARHLDVCEPCRGRRDDVEGMTGALRRASEAPPAALVAQLDRAVLGTLARTRAAAPAPARPRSAWPPALAGLAAVLLIGTVAFFAGRRTAPEPAPRIVVREAAGAPAVESRPRPEPEPIPQSPPRKPEARVVPEERRPEPKPAFEIAPVPQPAISRPFPAPPPPPPPPPPKPGDLNGDGLVDIADARILQQRLTQGLPLPAHADLNGDGVVDIADVREILRAELAAR